MPEPRQLRTSDGRRVSIRPATVDDAFEITAIDRELAVDGRGMVLLPYQIRTVEEEKTRLEEVLLRAMQTATLPVVAEHERGVPRLLATAQLDQLGPGRCRHVGAIMIGVRPEAQGLGVGRACVQYLIDHARARRLERIELYVRADNERARALYASVGFVHEATRARFVKLEDGTYVDDHIMSLFL
jgi:putative acetyltransferase